MVSQVHTSTLQRTHTLSFIRDIIVDSTLQAGRYGCGQAFIDELHFDIRRAYSCCDRNNLILCSAAIWSVSLSFKKFVYGLKILRKQIPYKS